MTRPLHPLSEALLAEKHWAFHAPARGCVEPCAFRDRLAAIEAAIREEATPTVEALREAIAETRRLYVGTPPNVDDWDAHAASVLNDVERRIADALATPTDADLARGKGVPIQEDWDDPAYADLARAREKEALSEALQALHDEGMDAEAHRISLIAYPEEKP